MHVVFRESFGLEETATPVDLGQDPADLVMLSFSDSDLAAFAAGWRRGRKSLPSLRLANLIALRHPLSVDTYIERTMSRAKGILVRLIGGESYWPYGIAALHQLARERGIALAVLPADGRDDPRLDELSTLPRSTLQRLKLLCDAKPRSPSSRWPRVSMLGPYQARPTCREKGFTIRPMACLRRCQRMTSRARW
jgi:cobaltochelatase CobN